MKMKGQYLIREETYRIMTSMKKKYGCSLSYIASLALEHGLDMAREDIENRVELAPRKTEGEL